MGRMGDVSETITFFVKYPSWKGLLDIYRAVTGQRLSYNQPLDRVELQHQTQLVHQALEEICAESLNNGNWPPRLFVLPGFGGEPKPYMPGQMIVRLELAESGKTGRYQAYLNFWDGTAYYLQVEVSRHMGFHSVSEARDRISRCLVVPIRLIS
jgi:hypothetical protein